ncbi:MAG: transglycosylase SLT domain-containing protein [Chloroherpetonaceae bacterium]|nr:transglycosylase SLT domain-containing protein [Chloroherpetonaceae bacterium]MDW8436993.1 transglycosylase SLT domain-containing protein [Chloroherpetonaceae bacterium]
MKIVSPVLLVGFLLVVGCSSSRQVSGSLARRDSLRVPDSLRAVAERDSIEAIRLKEAELREAARKRRGKIAEASRLYDLALSQINSSRDSARQSLRQVFELINELADSDKPETDSTLCGLAFYALQTYHRYIQPLKELDSDDPALAIHERLFGRVDEITVDESKFLGFILPKTTIPLELNDDVKKFITYFSTRHKEHFQRYLKRAEFYFPMMERIIAEEGMPPEIINLAIVESGVNPLAHSRANALGMWQFIKPTGKLYGLEGNQWFDERRNLEKSTRASMRFLKNLYEAYGDWHLALAAYNGGPGKVNRAIKQAKSKDFWKVRKFFRRETREYVPRFIAATIIAMNPERFGFEPIRYKDPIPIAKFPVPQGVSLETIARYSRIALDTLIMLNPELIKGVTPPAYDNYPLVVPIDRLDAIEIGLIHIPDEERRHFIAYKARGGESVKALAKKHGVEAKSLYAFNGLKSWTLQKGAVLMIPVSPEVAREHSFTTADLSDDSAAAMRYGRRYRYARAKTYKKTMASASRKAKK